MNELTMEVMDSTGHSKHIWDVDNEDEVAAAKTLFDSLRERGFRAFHVKKDGEEGERMDTFASKAGKMIMVPQLRGG